MQKQLFHPGERAEISGQYGLCDEAGQDTGLEVTVVQGEPLPPTPRVNMFYKLNDPTRHKPE